MKTIGEFYREKILNLPKAKLSNREIPLNRGDVRIDRDLFGWKLHTGKDFIECRSEAEARYLKIFIEANMTEVCVPIDDEYLYSILDELEKIKGKIDEIIDSYLVSILDRKVKERVRHEVLMEITA